MARLDRPWALVGGNLVPRHAGGEGHALHRVGRSLLPVAVMVACSSAPGQPPKKAEGAKPAPAVAEPAAPRGCDSGVRDGFADPKRFPRIAACAGSWDEPGLLRAEAGGDSSASALCAAGWHICTSVAEVKRRSGGQGCAAAGLSEGSFFAILEGATKPPQCFTRGFVGVLGCGLQGAPAPKACSPMDRVSNPGCSALGAPWACEKNNELWSMVKTQHAGGGVLCCEGPSPQLMPTTGPWGFGSGTPFTGGGKTPCGEVTLTTTHTEPWGDGAFRNVPGADPAVVIFTFSRSVSAFHLSVRLSGSKAYMDGFGVPPSRVIGSATFVGREVRMPRGSDESTALLSWFGLPRDALAMVMGGKGRATVLIEGYGISCE